MSVQFKSIDILHQIVVKFVKSFLPAAKKPFRLKPVHSPILNEHGVASKAEIYKFTTDPAIIEEGLNAAVELMLYLLADGYRIRTKLFSMKMRLPGEYDGTETQLVDGRTPELSVHASKYAAGYIAGKVTLEFEGVEEIEGFISEAINEASGVINEAATKGNVLTIHGKGLKIAADDYYKDDVGILFRHTTTGAIILAPIVPVNEPRTIKVIVPAALVNGGRYTIIVRTQSSVGGGSNLLKEPREVVSKFTVRAIDA